MIFVSRNCFSRRHDCYNFCYTEPQGCQAVINLEKLALHVSSCEYNSSSKTVCDKGCNMKVTRQEYEINNCFSHLANKVKEQEMEIIKAGHDLSNQKEYFERIVNRLQDENRKLNDEIGSQYKEINNELSHIRSQLEHFQNALSNQQQHTTQLSDISSTSLRPLKWQKCFNVKITKSNILKLNNTLSALFVGGFVQSDYPLEPAKSTFKIHLLSISEAYRIGLIQRTHESEFIYYDCFGCINFSGVKVHDGPKWEVGDVIECGVKFPKNFVSDGNQSAIVYVSKNDERIFEKSITIPKDGLLPMISLYGKDTRLQYFQ